MLTDLFQETPQIDSDVHLAPRRLDRLGERWIFRAPVLHIHSINLDLPIPLVRFQPTSATVGGEVKSP